MNNNPREMDDPTYGRQYGNRFSDPMDRERRNGGYGRDAMDPRNRQQGRENRQWGADRYESNPYGNRHIDDRGSEDRDRYTQESTTRNPWATGPSWESGPTWNSRSNWDTHSDTNYWPDRNNFENRDYNFRNYSDMNASDHDYSQRSRRELNDSDYGRMNAPDHRRGYENQNRQRYGEVFGRGESSRGSPSWGERYQNRHFASGDRSQMGGQEMGGSRSRSSRYYLDRSYDDSDANQRIYDHGRFMTSSQYEHDRNAYGPVPGFGWPRGEHYGKGPKGYKRADARIQEEVSDALYHDPNIDASEIEVSVKDGIVTLSGSVSDRRMKRMAEECVERISGVHDVRNQISAGGFFSRLFEGDKSGASTTAKSTDKTVRSDKTDKSSSSPNMM